MPRKFWGVPRGKRSLVVSIEVLKTIEPKIKGRVWSKELQKEIDQFLVEEDLKRERMKIDDNPGSLRGNFTTLKAFGLVYRDFDNKVQLTKAGEELIDSKTPRTIKKNILRKQLLNFQFPCPYAQKGHAKIISDYKIKPYRFLLELLLTDEIDYITLEEAARFIVFAQEPSEKDLIKESILEYRGSESELVLQTYFDEFDHRGISLDYSNNLISEEVTEISNITDLPVSKVEDILLKEAELERTYRPNSRWTATYKSRWDVVSTMKTHLTEAELISSDSKNFELTPELRELLQNILGDTSHFPKDLIPFEGYSQYLDPDEKKLLELRFLNKYGRGWNTKSGIQRSSLKGKVVSRQKVKERTMKSEYEKAVKTKVVSSKLEAIEIIKDNTQYSKEDIAEVVKNSPSPDLNEFAKYFIEIGKNGDENLEFEKLCQAVFSKLGFESEHVGQKGRYPDVLAMYDSDQVGLIDAKATSGEYSVVSSDERAMRDYVTKFRDEKYKGKSLNVGFFVFVAGATANTSDTNINNIYQDTGVPGSIISASTLMDLLRLQIENPKNIAELTKLFKLNREIVNSDLEKLWT
ncbi:hypothetical protein JCM16358_10960 [Halanaerocella petrolearia]